MSVTSLKVLRMRSGEDVLSMIEDHGNSVTLVDAVTLIPTQHGQVQFIPYVPFAEKGTPVEIQKDFIVYIVDPAQEMSDHYRQMTSGLLVEPKQGIIHP